MNGSRFLSTEDYANQTELSISDRKAQSKLQKAVETQRTDCENFISAFLLHSLPFANILLRAS